jgi:hypothetical protein
MAEKRGFMSNCHRADPVCSLDCNRIWWSTLGSPKVHSSSRRYGTLGSYPNPVPACKKVTPLDGILRNVGTRWDQGLRRNPPAQTTTQIVASLTCWLRHNY